MCNFWFGIWYYFLGQIRDVGGVSMKSSLSSPSSHECLSLKKKKKLGDVSVA